MNEETLSLKNLYRLIRSRDYPVYSDGVLSAAQTKGLTLLSFWKQVLCDRWLQTFHGKSIWRSEGTMNRLLSELCNRKSGFPYYREYPAELLSELTPSEYAYQAELFVRFLRERNYRPAVFRAKLSVFLDRLNEADRPAAVGPVHEILSGNAYPDVPEDFLNGWILTGLTLFALSDGRITAESLTGTDPACLPDQLYHRSAVVSGKEAEIMTHRSSELWHSALPADAFFGRQRELFDLAEAVREEKKVLVCGPGGVGKTELVRQLLIRELSQGTFSRIAAVQYVDDLSRSLVKSFLNLTGATPDERYHECLYLLNLRPDTLLLIDNLDRPDDPALRAVSQLSCSVVITSRVPSLEGFSPLPLENPDAEAASLIFRSHYNRAILPSDRDPLQHITAQDQFRHPLTITLLARAARTNRWSIRELLARMEDGYTEIHFTDNRKDIRIQAILRRLYFMAGFRRENLRLLRLLSILPYQSYAQDLLSSLADFGTLKVLSDTAAWLAARGWVNLDSGGDVSMHPLIAECIRMRKPSEEEFPPPPPCQEM